jgi:hypothetical protein
MRCLGCDKVIRSRNHRSFTWGIWQICPSCFNSLVPNYYPKTTNYYPKTISGRMVVHNR